MFSKFFIDRPIFATVVSMVIVIAGLVAMGALPIAQYPDITPPTIEVSATYPGASAEVVAETVASPIEEEVNGVQGMLYLSSNSDSDGRYTLTVTFAVGTDLDIAQVLVQNRVARAEPKLPVEVRQQGVEVEQKAGSTLMFVTMSSPNSRFDSLYIHNYAALRIKDELARIPGVGDVFIYGADDYSMRVWLDPEKLKARGLGTQDVVRAISEQNVQVAAGAVGKRPAPAGLDFQFTVSALGRLSDVEQFADIIVKTGEGGRITRVRDVARVELGAEDYRVGFQVGGEPAAGIGINQQPGANALEVAEGIRETMERLSKAFPEGLEYKIPYDTTLFIDASIQQVVQTLFEAALLVFVTIFIFLQNWRATIIPAVAIPISLVGTFALMAALGISINMITLFGLVLAIGIVVDDAIVVVENTYRHLEAGLQPKEAAVQAMKEISGPVVATTLVLVAVFVPSAFLPGITGELYRQFALTIATATVISSINALTMSPALAALILRPPTQRRQNILFRGFNRVYEGAEKGYTGLVGGMVRRAGLSMVLYLVLVAVGGWGFMSLPTGFLPIEDKGYAIAAIQLPDAASYERTEQVVTRLNEVMAEAPGVANWIGVTGYSVLDGTTSSNAATFFVTYDDWEIRAAEGVTQETTLGYLNQGLQGIQEAVGFAMPPPPINGLGQVGGFDLRVRDIGGADLTQLQQMVRELIVAGNAQSGLEGLFSVFRADVPQLFVDVDRTKAKTLGLELSDVFGTLQAYMGSAYVNDFNRFGRTYQVRVQAEPRFRVEARDLLRLEVRNDKDQMVPVGTLMDVQERLGPQVIGRYNLFPAASITGGPAPGFSSGEALSLMEQLAAANLPSSMDAEWTGLSYQEKQVGNEAIMIFVLAVLLVFLVLAAQYESWTSPAAVVLAVPLGLIGVSAALMIRAMDNNVYTQIGVVLLIALASKNAILIVEFARELRAQGRSIKEAAIEAARLRFRPILMTSFAFIFGVLPLVFAGGAGAASQRAVGTAVFGGMLAATFLTVLFVPTFYRVMQGLGERFSRGSKGAEPAVESA